MHIFAKTHIGKERKRNEDCIYYSKEKALLAVADGLGGHLAGEFASKKAVDMLIDELRVEPKIVRPKYLAAIIKKINDEIFRISLSNIKYDGMGSTLVFALKREDRIYIANIGDSRAYLLRNGHLRQLTVDHSHVQYLLEKGEISFEEMRRHPLRNLITKSLGLRISESPDIFDLGVEEGDLYLLCSDGLTNMLTDQKIKELLLNHMPLKKKVAKLIDAANEKGGKDNISAGIMTIDTKDLEI
ncbi:MAG: Stp1/IreP family PP2C-type Ser/Thr phosphatase [bacterium]